MQGWPIALFAATGVSGLLAFGIVQSAFAPQAQALFLLFGALLLTIVATRMLLRGGGGHGRGHGRGGHGAHHGGHGGHGEGALTLGGRAMGTLFIIALALGGVYFWTDNQLTAEKIGRHIDGGVAGLGRQAHATFVTLRDDLTAPAEEGEQDTAQN
jgi:hypothetical protein